MENQTKTITKLWLIFELCYFTKCTIDNRLSRANDLTSIIREITIQDTKNLNFILDGKNTARTWYSPIKWRVIVKDNEVIITKKAKKCTLDSGLVSEGRETKDIYLLID